MLPPPMSAAPTALMAIKVFQSYYEHNILQNEPPSNVAWIGSIQYGLVRLPVRSMKPLYGPTD